MSATRSGWKFSRKLPESRVAEDGARYRRPVPSQFAAERFIRSSRTQKLKCRAVQDLSIHIKWLKIRFIFPELLIFKVSNFECELVDTDKLSVKLISQISLIHWTAVKLDDWELAMTMLFTKCCHWWQHKSSDSFAAASPHFNGRVIASNNCCFALNHHHNRNGGQRGVGGA